VPEGTWLFTEVNVLVVALPPTIHLPEGTLQAAIRAGPSTRTSSSCLGLPRATLSLLVALRPHHSPEGK
jgi:hypothetical protein